MDRRRHCRSSGCQGLTAQQLTERSGTWILYAVELTARFAQSLTTKEFAMHDGIRSSTVRRGPRWGAFAGALLGLVLLSASAFAVAPAAMRLEGVIMGAGGAPVPDGDYDLVLALYAASTGGTAVWSEGPVKVKVMGGRFDVVAGATKPIDALALAALAEAYIGIKVGSDPELPRSRMYAAPYALHAANAAVLSCSGCVGGDHLANGAVSAAKLGFNYAGSSSKGGPALDLGCTGCVSVAELVFDGDVDLGANSLKAKNGTFTGDLVAKSVVATQFVGDGSKLTGLALPSGSCSKPGEVVKGIAADGKLICTPGLDPSALPKDALDEVSNGLLTNQFVDTIETTSKGKAIPDNTGEDGVATIDFPDIGLAQSFALTVEVHNTDLAAISMQVLPPDDKKVGWTLCDPCGKKDEKAFKVTYTPSNAPAVGAIAAWVGQNPKGQWTLKVKDAAFCLPQAPGNDKLCNTVAKTDGTIVDFSIQIQTLSSKKVAATGVFQATSGLQLQASEKAPVVCSAATLGYLYYDPKARMLHICNGVEFDIVETLPGGFGSKGNPAKSCKEIVAKDKGAKSGVYWLDPDGDGPSGKAPVHCEMQAQGGGWVLVMQAQSGHGTTFGFNASHWTGTTVVNDAAPAQLSSVNAKYETFNSYKTTDGQVMLRDKVTGLTTVLAVPNMVGTTLLDRFQKLGSGAGSNNSGVALTLVAGAASPQELMGYPAPSQMCSQLPAKWRMNMLSSHSGVRIGNDVATNGQTVNNPSSWVCYDNATNLSYSGLGGTLESGRQWQDGFGSESLDRYRSNGGTGQGSQHGVDVFVR